MTASARLRCLGRQRLVLRGQPVDQFAQMRVAFVAQRLELGGGQGLRGRAYARNRRACQLAGHGFKFAASLLEGVQLFEQEFVRPRDAQFQAVQHVNHAKSLSAREFAFDARDDLLAQGGDHAVNQPGQRVVHGARSRILAICRSTGAICVAIAGMRMSLKRPSSKQRAAAMWVSASFSNENTM